MRSLAVLLLAWAVSGSDIYDLVSNEGEYSEPSLPAERETCSASEHALAEYAKHNPRCQKILLKDREQALELAHESRPLPHMVNRCPKTRRRVAYRRRRGRPRVVFCWLLHERAQHVTRIARELLESKSGVVSYVLFHVDASAAPEEHARIERFAELYPDFSAVVPSVDIEWGGYSFVEAQLSAMRLAVDRWPGEWDHIAWLSASDVPLGGAAKFASFWKRVEGKSFFGALEKDRVPWNHLLNNYMSSCDNLTVSHAWRKTPLSYQALVAQTGVELYVGNTQAFFAYDYVTYVLSGRDPNLTALRELVGLAQSVDEIVWPTIFMNSPLCHQLARLKHGREYFLYLWPTRQMGEQQMCRLAEFQKPNWMCGLRPLWLTKRDAPRLAFYRDTLFIRKADPVHSNGLLPMLHMWRETGLPELTRHPQLRFQIQSIGRCLELLSANPPTFRWKFNCSPREALFTATCSGPLRVLQHAGRTCIKSGNGIADEPAMCTIHPVKSPGVCLMVRGSAFIPGIPVGLGECQSYKENAMFRFIKCGRLQHAAGNTLKVFGAGIHGENGLCLSESTDRNSLMLVSCSEASSVELMVQSSN